MVETTQGVKIEPSERRRQVANLPIEIWAKIKNFEVRWEIVHWLGESTSKSELCERRWKLGEVIWGKLYN
jgi:hypothetical protein